MAEIKRVQVKIGNKKVMDELVEEAVSKAREAWGPNPPCVICKKESKFAIARTLTPSDLDDLREYLATPFGAYFCEAHSDEEISKWFKARGVNLEVEIKRGG